MLLNFLRCYQVSLYPICHAKNEKGVLQLQITHKLFHVNTKATRNSTMYQQIVQANNNNNDNKYKTIQAPHYWSCVRETTVTSGFPSQKASSESAQQ